MIFWFSEVTILKLQRLTSSFLLFLSISRPFRFEAIWREHGNTGKPRSVISTELSTTLNNLSQELEATDLFSQKELRNAVLQNVFPPTLVKKVGLETLISRIPEAYARSAFAAYVAASFIYENGPGASHVAFYKHIAKLMK